MFKDSYAALHSHIKPHEAFIDATIDIAARKRLPFKRRRCKPILVEVAVCVLILISIPVLVATVDPIYDMVYSISPSIAQFFRPIKRHAVDQGIKIEIEKAYRTNSAVKMYATIQDLTGDRIDEDIEIYYTDIDVYTPEHHEATATWVNYDEKTKTHTILITVVGADDKKLEHDEMDASKITVTIKAVRNKGERYESYRIPINLGEVEDAEKTVSSDGKYDGIVTSSDLDDVKQPILALAPQDDVQFRAPSKYMYIDNIGYIDNKLHALIGVTDSKEYNSCRLYLMDNEINSKNPRYVISMPQEANDQSDYTDPILYQDYVFWVPRSDMSKYGLYMDFTLGGPSYEGDWTVTVPVQDTRKQKTASSSAE